jgi:hypothetical protein
MRSRLTASSRLFARSPPRCLPKFGPRSTWHCSERRRSRCPTGWSSWEGLSGHLPSSSVSRDSGRRLNRPCGSRPDRLGSPGSGRGPPPSGTTGNASCDRWIEPAGNRPKPANAGASEKLPSSGSAFLGRNRGDEPFAALEPAPREHLAATNGLHARTEAVNPLPLQIAWLIGSFQDSSSGRTVGDRRDGLEPRKPALLSYSFSRVKPPVRLRRRGARCAALPGAERATAALHPAPGWRRAPVENPESRSRFIGLEPYFHAAGTF